MLGEIVGVVITATFPMNQELTLTYAIAYPVKAHINSFGTALLVSVIGDARGSVVVSLDWSRWLWVTEFDKSGSDWTRVFGIGEQSTEFCFGGARHNHFHNAAGDMDGSTPPPPPLSMLCLGVAS